PIAADGTAGTLTVVDNNNTGWAGTYDYLYAGGELTYSNSDGVAAIPFYLDGALGTFSWNNMPAFTVTHVEAEAPEVGGDLNGTYHVNFLMDGLYVLTFDNGTLTVEDNNTTQYTGTYTYSGSPATGMTVLNEDGTETDIFISVGLDGNPTFQCGGLMMAQPLVKVEGEQDDEDEPANTPDGEYIVDFSGFALYTLTFDNGLLTIVDDNTGLRSGTYTYEINADGGIDVYLDGELTMDISIGVSFDGSYTFQCPELMMPQSLVPSSGGDIGGGDTSDQLVIGDNSVWVENAWMGTYMTFTAPATGNYTLAPAFGEYNAVVIIEDTYSSEMVEFPYTFYLGEGDVMTFLVMTDNFEPDTIDLVITQEGGSQGGEQPSGGALVLGENSVYVQVLNFWPQQTEMTFTAPWAGTFTLSLAAGEFNADIYDAFGNWIENIPYTFTLEAGESITFYFATLDFMVDEDYIDVVIAEGEAPPEEPGVELVLGENSVYVTVTNFFQDQTKVTFTAPFAGTFTISWADGETNGDLYDAFGNWFEVMPYTFTLEAGESINFYVQSTDWEITEDFIELVIAGEKNENEEIEPAELDGEYRVDFSGVTYYTLMFKNGVMMLTDDNAKLYSGTYTYQITANGGYTFFKDDVETTDILIQILPNGSYTFQCPSLKIPFAMVKYEKPSDDGVETVRELILGESTILVTNGWAGVHIPFVAPESGIYVLSPAEGEMNAVIIIEEENVTELIYLSASNYTFFMEAGQTKNFIIATHSHSADTISLVLSLQTPADEPG
ncbi:MAG: hypothetical protein IKY29_01510, partial [Clostridia bacterium]|nr:hypothetical protein [Clostridia bacterium]